MVIISAYNKTSKKEHKLPRYGEVIYVTFSPPNDYQEDTIFDRLDSFKDRWNRYETMFRSNVIKYLELEDYSGCEYYFNNEFSIGGRLHSHGLIWIKNPKIFFSSWYQMLRNHKPKTVKFSRIMNEKELDKSLKYIEKDNQLLPVFTSIEWDNIKEINYPENDSEKNIEDSSDFFSESSLSEATDSDSNELTDTQEECPMDC